MASNTRKARAKESWKVKPNKANLKANMKRTAKNREILRKLAAEEK